MLTWATERFCYHVVILILTVKSGSKFYSHSSNDVTKDKDIGWNQESYNTSNIICILFYSILFYSILFYLPGYFFIQVSLAGGRTKAGNSGNSDIFWIQISKIIFCNIKIIWMTKRCLFIIFARNHICHIICQFHN